MFGLFHGKTSPEVLSARLLTLREAVQKKVTSLEAKHRQRRFPLEKAHQEFRRNLSYLLTLKEEGRHPLPLLEQAILREELRLRHLEEELRRMEEAFQNQVSRLWIGARIKAAKIAARNRLQIDLDQIFPGVENGNTPRDHR